MGQPQGATPLLIAQGSRREEGTTWAVFLTKGDVDLLADPARPALLALQQPPGCPSTFLRALVRWSGGGGCRFWGQGGNTLSSTRTTVWEAQTLEPGSWENLAD